MHSLLVARARRPVVGLTSRLSGKDDVALCSVLRECFGTRSLRRSTPPGSLELSSVDRESASPGPSPGPVAVSHLRADDHVSVEMRCPLRIA